MSRETRERLGPSHRVGEPELGPVVIEHRVEVFQPSPGEGLDRLGTLPCATETTATITVIGRRIEKAIGFMSSSLGDLAAEGLEVDRSREDQVEVSGAVGRRLQASGTSSRRTSETSSRSLALASSRAAAPSGVAR